MPIRRVVWGLICGVLGSRFIEILLGFNEASIGRSRKSPAIAWMGFWITGFNEASIGARGVTREQSMACRYEPRGVRLSRNRER